MCDVNDIKKARYTIQVIAPVLYTLLKEAFNEANDNGLSFEAWVKQQNGSSFNYWHGVLEFQKNINLLVRSLREANFTLFIASLETLCPLFFSLDHVHYARWISVFIHDLKMLKVKDNELYQHFEAGFFTVMKSKTAFSKMAYDQCHEQNNKVMKSKSGIVDLLNKEDTAFLRRLELASPEIQEYLHEIENVEDKQARPHKEASPTFVLKYIGDCRAVYNRFTTNPFLDTQFQKLNTTAFFPECIVEDAGRVFALGKEQYADFKETRFILGSADVIKTSIPRNSLKLPSSARKVQIESPQIKLTASTIIKLRNACINRESPAKDIFKSEFTGKTIIYYYY